MAKHDDGPAPELRGKRCECGACGLFFTSVTSFDEHRVGPVEDRRCLTPAELIEKGLVLRDDHFWGSPPMDEAARERMRALREKT